MGYGWLLSGRLQCQELTMSNNDSSKSVIVVHFSIFQRYGYQRHECRIPVPDDCGFEAQQVAAEIAGYCKAELRVFDRK